MNEQPSFTCPRCGRTSYHPEDVANCYCGFCHIFWTAEYMEELRIQSYQKKGDTSDS